MIKYIILICTLIFLSGGTAHADTHAAESCSQAHVDAAITASASGDTVTIPAGDCTGASAWTSPLTSISSKTLTISGAGQGSTIIEYNYTGASSLLNITLAGSETFDISGITFNCENFSSSSVTAILYIQSSTLQTSASFRVHSITFANVMERAIIPYRTYGVIDGCTFTKTASGTPQMISVFGGSTFEAGSWNTAYSMGVETYVYVENNTFTYPTDIVSFSADGMLDCYGGGRYVIRYNQLNNVGFGHHGTDSGGYLSCHSFEAYNNILTNNATVANIPNIFHSRGGSGVIYSNVINGTGGWSAYFSLSNYRSTASYQYWQTCDGSNYKACSNSETFHACDNDTQCDGSSEPTTGGTHSNLGTCSYYWNVTRTSVGEQDATYNYYFDINDSAGYPCAFQVGRTTGQALAPLYEWNNCKAGLACADGGENDISFSDAGTYIVANRDYYNNTQKSAYTPYTCPHPLTGLTGTCDSAVAGTAGYNVSTALKQSLSGGSLCGGAMR